MPQPKTKYTDPNTAYNDYKARIINESQDRFKPCVVLLEDTFDGKLTDYKGNNETIELSAPYKYIEHIYQLLKNRNPHYSLSIFADTTDNRIFHHAIIQYGRRRLTYTNVVADKRQLAPRSNDQYITYRVEQSHVTTWNLSTKMEASKWAQEKHAIWCGKSEKGGYDPNKSKWTQKELPNGTVLISGKYWHKDKFKTLEYNSFIHGKQLCITIRIKETSITTRIIEPNVHIKLEDGTKKDLLYPGKWIKETKKEAEKAGWSGEVYINVDKNGHYKLFGKWNKSWEVGKGSNHQKHFITQIWTSDSIAREKQFDENYQPSIKSTYTTFASDSDKDSARARKTTSSRAYRSYKQDQDTYMPEIKRDLRKEEHRSINAEYHQYNKDMRLYDRLLLIKLEIENLKNENKKHKLTTPENKAKLWLQKINREQPDWLKKSNATMLINYCIACIKKGAMVGAEATEYCENHAK